MKQIAVTLIVLFIAASLSGCGPRNRTAFENPPNVVIVLVDTLRADRIEAKRNDIPIMPFVSSLAEDSWNYENAYAQATWTKPSVVSLWTSLYPETHQVEFGLQRELVKGQDLRVQPLYRHLNPIASYFKYAGYYTLGVQTNNHLTHRQDFDRGFKKYELLSAAPAEEVTSKAIELMDKTKTPFFMYVHYIDPHGPYEPPKPYRTHFGEPPSLSDEDKEILKSDVYNDFYHQQLLKDLGLSESNEYGELSENGRQYIRQMYDGECRYADEQIKRLVQSIEKLDRDTIIIFTSDHGEEFWEHGALGHAKTVYQELCNVPLLIKIPDESPKKINTPVELIDVLPTLAAYLGVKPNPDWQGRSLYPDTKTELKEQPVFVHTRSSLKKFNVYKEAIVDGNEKLILDRNKDQKMLFDLKNDPHEQQNLVNDQPDKTVTMNTLIDEHTNATQGHKIAQFKPEYQDLDSETAEQMRALGYPTD